MKNNKYYCEMRSEKGFHSFPFEESCDSSAIERVKNLHKNSKILLLQKVFPKEVTLIDNYGKENA